MSLRVSGKHMDVGEAFRSTIEARINDATAKYFSGNYSGHVIMEKSGARFDCECTLHLDSGVNLQSKGDAHDPHGAFEAAAERLEKRLRRYKRRLKDHHAGARDGQQADVAYSVFQAVDDDVEEVAEDYAPAIIAESSVVALPMSVADAVIRLDLKEDPVFLFRNTTSNEINIVYRRADGNIGWINPAAAKRD